MNADKFWSGWLKVTMIMIILAGIGLTLIYNFGSAEFLDKKIDKVFFSGNDPGEYVHNLKTWMISITGSLMAAWGLTILYLVNNAFQRRKVWAWRSIFYPLLLLYLLDTSISAWFAAGFNVFLNTVIFLQVIAPLLFLRNQFFRTVKTGS